MVAGLLSLHAGTSTTASATTTNTLQLALVQQQQQQLLLLLHLFTAGTLLLLADLVLARPQPVLDVLPGREARARGLSRSAHHQLVDPPVTPTAAPTISSGSYCQVRIELRASGSYFQVRIALPHRHDPWAIPRALTPAGRVAPVDSLHSAWLGVGSG